MKKNLVKILFFIITLFIVSCNKSSKLRFVTGGESGTYYAFGSVIAQIVSTNSDVDVIGVVGAGSKSNVDELQDKSADFAFCQSDVLSYAYNGTNIFKDSGKVDNLRVVASLYAEPIQIISVDSSIKSVSDLKGKRVSIGASGSGVYFNAIDVLNAYGLTLSDIKPTYQSFGDSVADIRDNKIDAAFIVSGAPTVAVVDLSTTKKVNLISIDDEHKDIMIKNNPFYSKYTIVKDVYKTESDIETVAVGAVVITRDDIPEDTVYKFTKEIFDKKESSVSLHAKFSELNFDFAVSVKQIPYHNGAIKYFKEKGYSV